MTMKQIRDKYKVPAKRGMEVTIGDMKGKIVGAKGLYLRIRFHDDPYIHSYHPTDQITYPE